MVPLYYGFCFTYPSNSYASRQPIPLILWYQKLISTWQENGLRYPQPTGQNKWVKYPVTEPNSSSEFRCWDVYKIPTSWLHDFSRWLTEMLDRNRSVDVWQVQRQFVRESNCVFNKWSWNKFGHHYAKKRIWPNCRKFCTILTCTKVTSKWILNLNVNIKL